jgi:hypothetical protein
MSALVAATLTGGAAHADVPVGPARLVPCPADTGNSANYPGAKAPYVCHSAVQDPLGNIVILRQGRSMDPDLAPSVGYTPYRIIMSRTTPSKKLSVALPVFLHQTAVSDISQSFALTTMP